MSDQLKSALASRVESASAAGNYIGPRQLLVWLWEVLKSATGDIDKPALKAYVLKLYDDYAAPYDIPGIPNVVVEPMVDRAIRKALEHGIDQLFESLSA